MIRQTLRTIYLLVAPRDKKIAFFQNKKPKLDDVAQTFPYFRPKWSKFIPYFKQTRLENHSLCGRTYRLLPHPTLLGLISYSAKGLGTNIHCFHLQQDRGWKSLQLTLLTVLRSTGKQNFIRKCYITIWMHERHQLISHCRQKTLKVTSQLEVVWIIIPCGDGSITHDLARNSPINES